MARITNYSQFLREFNSPRFRDLWDGQKDILNQYSKKFQEKSNLDLAIELPTGAGKTLIALLIAEAKRLEGDKVAILSANKTLARQLKKEADHLGIEIVLMEGSGDGIPPKDKRSYKRAKKIAVMNYWIYFNQNPKIDSADLLIMDDAHLAEFCLNSLYSFEINRFEHENLFRELVGELSSTYPEYKVLQNALDDNIPSDAPPELFSFIDQLRFEARLKEIVGNSQAISENLDLSFRWSRIKDSLPESNIYFAINSIWIRPYIYPLLNNSYYESAKQRIYMSATIGDPADLSRRLGTKKVLKISENNKSQETSGRRLIVMVAEKDGSNRLEKSILSALKILPKSLWICNSKINADKHAENFPKWLEECGVGKQKSWILTSLGNEMNEFKKSSDGHLFVGGRFDGMDFQGDECRLVIVPALPRAINIQEHFIGSYMRDSDFMIKRLNQRIIQSLGRCNRAQNDYAVYILAGNEFVAHFGRDSNRNSIPKNIMAEIDMAEDMADESVNKLEKTIEDFLTGQFSDFDSKLEELLAGVPDFNTTNGEAEDNIVEDEITAWSAMFHSKNYTTASKKFEECAIKTRDAKKLEMSAFMGWCYAKALYLDCVLRQSGNKNKALDALEDAINRGGHLTWFNIMRASLNRERGEIVKSQNTIEDDYQQYVIEAFDRKLEKVGERGNKFEQWSRRLHEKLDSQKHNEFLDGFAELGAILGYDTYRPKHNSASDCNWIGIFGNYKEAITFEAKIEHIPGNKIDSKAIGQAHNQFHTAKERYENRGFKIRSVIITHLKEMEDSAKSSIGDIKIIHKEAIIKLWEKVKKILLDYRSNWSADDIHQRRMSAEAIRTKIPSKSWLSKAIDSDNHFITTDILLKEWNPDYQ